jgi:hypothetical protein
MEKPVLRISLSDLVRATLDEDSGNVGYLGLSPDGTRYHVVVPVDRQIARGIKAGNWILEGPPFGGYRHWHYFCCSGYRRPGRYDEKAIEKIRREQAQANGRDLVAWAAGLNIKVEIPPV